PSNGPRVREKRREQAEELANWVQTEQSASPAEHIVMVGDFNAFQFNDGYVDVIGTIKGTPTPSDNVVLASPDLVDPDLTDLVDTVAPDQRYSFAFNGNLQEIDHVLVNQALMPFASRLAYGRMDAGFPESYRNDPARPERVSDHDPIVAYFKLPFT